MKNEYSILSIFNGAGARNVAMAFAITVFLTVSSAFTYKTATVAEDATASVGDEKLAGVAAGAFEGEYRIGPGDAVKIMVYENPEYSDSYRIGPDGKISLPIVGTIDAAGRTRDGLREHLREKLSKYIANPIVTVKVDEYCNNFVTVLGDAARPGRYEFAGEITFMALLSRLVDAFRDGAARCDIIREGSAVISIDLSDRGAVLQSRHVSGLKLRSGDSVYLMSKEGSAGFVYIVGDVRNPGLFRIEAGKDLLGTISSSVEVTGGKARSIRVIRHEKGKNSSFEYRSAKDTPLAPGDIVYISGDAGRGFSYCLKKIAPYVLVAVIGNEAVRKLKK